MHQVFGLLIFFGLFIIIMDVVAQLVLESSAHLDHFVDFFSLLLPVFDCVSAFLLLKALEKPVVFKLHIFLFFSVKGMPQLRIDILRSMPEIGRRPSLLLPGRYIRHTSSLYTHILSSRKVTSRSDFCTW